MDTTIVGTGRDKQDSLLFNSDTLNEGLPVFSLVERLHIGDQNRTNEFRVHLTALNSSQLSDWIISAEDLVEAGHELLATKLLQERQFETEAWEEDEIAEKEAMVENPPRDTDRYAH